MVVQLPHFSMSVDPRIIIGGEKGRGYKCRFSVHGRTLTITRIDDGDDDADAGWDAFRLRAYLSTEDIPDFTSTIYTYWGLRDECAPKDTTELNFHPSVTTIKRDAFAGCTSLVRVTIPDTVRIIERAAFYDCDSLTYIQLPRNLISLGDWAFSRCESLQAVFLPPTVTHIDDRAFQFCKSLKFFYLPDEIEHIGVNVVGTCDQLLTTVKYKMDDNYRVSNSDEVNQWLMQRHAHSYLHRACSSTLVTRHDIEVCIQQRGMERATEVDDQQMTALHILCANPHVTGDSIRSYLQLAPEAAANAQDGTGKTGLHILCSLPYLDTSTGDGIRSYLNLAPEAVNVHDSKGKTPFQYLCNSDDTLLEDRSFSTLMIWWYNCMP